MQFTKFYKSPTSLPKKKCILVKPNGGAFFMDKNIKKTRLILIPIIIALIYTGIAISPDQVAAASKQTKRIKKVVQVAKKKKGKSRKAFPNYFARNWCSDFVHWTAKKAKLANNKVFPKGRKSVSALISWYKKKGQYHKNTKKFKPKKGDLVFLSSSSHVGIVAKVTKKNVYIIHGNWSRKVKYTKLKKQGYTKSQRAKIKGYARPKY